jgi:Zn-dependent metalloprotease
MGLKKSTPKAINLFYSYSHKDAKLRDALAAHLSVLKRQGIINEWYDREIPAGEEWKDQINENLDRAGLILLLISADFVASDYCWGKEMKRALERDRAGEARVVPVIVRPVNWSGAPFARLQALPKDSKPVTVWANRDSAWLDVAKGISKVAEELSIVGKTPTVRRAPADSVTKDTGAATQRPSPYSAGALHRTVYDAQNNERLPGKLVRSEGDPSTSDIAVNEVYDALGVTYNFFKDIYGRNSIDDKGMPLMATVHYSQNYDNSFWTGKQVVVGDGDGQLFNRFSISLDVCAHSLVHGIIQSESNLNYWEQTGALVESLSDVFGSLVKQYAVRQTANHADWVIGSGLLAPKVKGKALRSLADPGTAYDDPVLGKDPQPSHMRAYVKTKEDNGGVHINMGIPNHAFYLIATELGGYAWERAGRIWYETLRDKHLKARAQFSEFAQLTHDNAQRLFGSRSAEAQAVKRGWDQVGLKVGRRRASA